MCLKYQSRLILKKKKKTNRKGGNKLLHQALRYRIKNGIATFLEILCLETKYVQSNIGPNTNRHFFTPKISKAYKSKTLDQLKKQQQPTVQCLQSTL